MPGRQHPHRTVRRLVAALEPPARGPLARAARDAVVLLAGLGLCAVLLLAAELHLDGAQVLAVRVAVVVLLAGGLGLAAHRLRARIEVMEAIRHAQDVMGEGVVLLEPETLEIVYASPAATAMFGRELLGLDIRDTLGADDRRLVDERRRLRSAGHRVPARAALPIVLPDGRRRFVEWATTPLTVDGRPLLLSILRDATARERAQRRLGEEHAFLEAVLDAAAGPIVVTGTDGRLLRVNAAAARLAGRDAAELVGRAPWELGLMRSEQAAEVAAALRDGRDPYRHLVASHDRLVRWSATAMRDAAGRLRSAVSVGVDVTEQRAAEDRARRALAALDVRSSELERANRDLAGFVALASHDLREGVQAVTGYTDLLDAHAQLDPRAADYLAATREAARTMAELLDGLAAYGRLGGGEALAADVDVDVDVDVEATLDGVLRELAEQLEARGAAVTRDPLPVVPGDPGELELLLSELVANALRHGGARIHVGADRAPLGWRLTVSADADVPPGAVGFALCRRIAERHGGAAWAEGRAFHVTLPDREAR